MILTEIEKKREITSISPEQKPHSLLVEKNVSNAGTVVHINENVSIGGNKLCVIAGPCSVESEEQIMETAKFVKSCGGNILRGGCFKPRTSPYDFQGLGEEGLKLLRQAGDIYNLPVVTEVMDAADIQLVAKYSDILQIGSRNALNYTLLKAVGKTNKPVLLKRGLMMTIKEFTMSAEYILSEGNPNVILCERGIRTFETETRNTLDISVIPILKEKTHLPIIVDPSHAAGKRNLILPLSMAAIAAGADGLIIECHNNPAEALCDGEQSLDALDFNNVINSLPPVSNAMNRTI
jgi:3-deoxy-7-phosphoheptulonate synthase